MVPETPTTVPLLASTKETPKRLLVVPLDWVVQVAAPSSVRKMVPKLPTTTTVLEPGAAAAKRPFPWGSGFCQNQPDCANDDLAPRAVMPNNRIEALKQTTFMASLSVTSASVPAT